VRHEDRLLFQKFPEVVFMDFTANTTKEKRPLYHMCFKTNTGCFTPLQFVSCHLTISFVVFLSTFHFSLGLCLRLSFPPPHVNEGKGAVAMRAYVPNEQGWICSLLHKVRPGLLITMALLWLFVCCLAICQLICPILLNSHATPYTTSATYREGH
jgi:hypothetical protein